MHTPKRVYKLKASDEQTLHYWITGIRNALKTVAGVTNNISNRLSIAVNKVDGQVAALLT